MVFYPKVKKDIATSTFGKSTRSCQGSYFEKWPWLTHVVAQDVVFFHLCVKTLKAKKMTCKQGIIRLLCKLGFPTPQFLLKTRVVGKPVSLLFILDPTAMWGNCFLPRKKENRRCLLKILARLKESARLRAMKIPILFCC